MPSAANAVPTRSRRGALVARTSGISCAAPIAAITPSGRLTKKTSLQPLPSRLASTSAPPTIGPSTADSPITGPKIANAVPCSEGANASRMIPNPWGIKSAAAPPCASRQAISISGEDANAHAIDAITNPIAPSTNMRLRP